MDNKEVGLTLIAIRVSFVEAVKNCSDEEKGAFLKMIEALLGRRVMGCRVWR